MSRIPLAEPGDLPSYLRTLHDDARDPDWSTRHVARAFAAQPGLLEHYLDDFYYPWHSNSGRAAVVATLSPRVKELVRLRIATLNGCQTCKAARLNTESVVERDAGAVDRWHESETFTAAEREAIRFAELMALDHHSIADDDIARLRRHFDDAQLLELLMMAGQYIGFGRLLAILQLETVSCPIPR